MAKVSFWPAIAGLLNLGKIGNELSFTRFASNTEEEEGEGEVEEDGMMETLHGSSPKGMMSDKSKLVKICSFKTFELCCGAKPKTRALTTASATSGRGVG